MVSIREAASQCGERMNTGSLLAIEARSRGSMNNVGETVRIMQVRSPLDLGRKHLFPLRTQLSHRKLHHHGFKWIRRSKLAGQVGF